MKAHKIVYKFEPKIIYIYIAYENVPRTECNFIRKVTKLYGAPKQKFVHVGDPLPMIRCGNNNDFTTLT